jgi:GH25 family lysozyme M1 (1,4-beta-N-acetylmuramidase)
VPLLHGFDVSHHQGSTVFPWQYAVDTFGITLGCAKVTEGSSFLDWTWRSNRAAMNAADVRNRGLYHWLRPDSPLEAQVRFFKAQVGELAIGEFVMLDVEQTALAARLTKQQCVDGCAAFSDAYPGRFIRYQGKFFPAGTDGDSPEFADWPWWLPAYTNTMPITTLPVAVWQWGGKTRGVQVPGLAGVDSNQILDQSALDSISGIRAATVPPIGTDSVFQGFVQDDTDHHFWARGVEYLDNGWSQWACLIQEIGIDWNLYGGVLPVVSRSALEAVHRVPAGPKVWTPSVGDRRQSGTWTVA